MQITPSLDAALALAVVPADIEATFVIGGAEIYKQALVHPQLRFVYLTRVAVHSAGEVHIPDLDRDFLHDTWDGEQALEDNGVRYRIERLIRR